MGMRHFGLKRTAFAFALLLMCGCDFRVSGLTPPGQSPADLAVPRTDDLSGAVSPADLTATPSDLATRDLAPAVAVRINVSGPAVMGVDYPGAWAADPGAGGVCGPLYFSLTAPIHGTVDQALFQTEAYGNPVTCTINGLPPGMYDVGLYFAEIYFGPGCQAGGTGTGARVFDIYLEGTRVLQNFDIFSQVGCAASTTVTTGKPIVKRFQIPITDGSLDISMPATVDNAKISAIEILSSP
jgi:hypothetical protein